MFADITLSNPISGVRLHFGIIGLLNFVHCPIFSITLENITQGKLDVFRPHMKGEAPAMLASLERVNI
jgi:hypothetical protein